MAPLLLLLLLPTSLAYQVFLNISDGNILIEMRELHMTINDDRSVLLCRMNETCFLLCTSSNLPWFNGSSACLEANVTLSPVETELHTAGVISIEQFSTCTLNSCTIRTVLPMLELLNSSSSGQGMNRLFYIKVLCQQLFNDHREVKKAYLSVEKKIIHNIMETSRPKPNDSIEYKLDLLSLSVINVSEAVLNSMIQIEAPQLLPQNSSLIPHIWLPASALDSIPEEERVIGLVSYMDSRLFQNVSNPSVSQGEQEEISSMVLRIELLGERHLRNLTTPIKMTFRNVLRTNMSNDSWLQCHYFDEHDWRWKTDGCETEDDQKNITCYCDHATPFAVLLMRDPIAEIHWTILSHITYIGCGLSAFFTALSLVIYIFGRNRRMDYSTSIHVCLSGALFLLNVTFLLNEWGATVEPDWVCVFVAAFMHYSLLCCFTWMAIEALHLYLLLIKVFNTYFKHYLVKLSLAGWGIPGVIVAVSLAMKDFKQFYGVTEMTMADTNQTNAICWITDDSFFYSLNLVYFTLIFVFNTGVLITVASNICKMKQVSRSGSKPGAEAFTPQRFNETCSSCLTVMGLTCLMGTTWGLAFLGSGYVNYPILYLFCILNSTQGFFIFLWICLSANKQRKRDMEERLTSAAVKTLTGVNFD